MNNSVEFIKNRIKSGNVFNDVPKDRWDISTIFYPLEVLMQIHEKVKDIIHNNSLVIELNRDENEKRKVKITYNPDCKDFEYFSSASATHDGTFIFIIDEARTILNKILMSETYNKMTAPNNYLDEIWKYDIEYIIGDIVLNSEYGMFNINGKTITGQKDYMVLPIKCEYIKH